MLLFGLLYGTPPTVAKECYGGMYLFELFTCKSSTLMVELCFFYLISVIGAMNLD